MWGLYLNGPSGCGTEPWIITQGNSSYKTNGVRFVTHDGGTLLLRDQVPDLEITKPSQLTIMCILEITFCFFQGLLLETGFY